MCKDIAKRDSAIVACLLLVLITWEVGSCMRDNDKFEKSRRHWDLYSAWIVKFRNSYAGNYVAPHPKPRFGLPRTAKNTPIETFP